MDKYTLPAGTYWVGDPCYAIPDELWMEWLHRADYMNNSDALLAEIGGHLACGISTAYGDGLYPGSDGVEYPVDAGLLGATPVAVAVDEPFGSKLVTFDAPFTCYSDDGTVHIGHIAIETGDEADDDDFSCWDCHEPEDNCLCE